MRFIRDNTQTVLAFVITLTAIVGILGLAIVIIVSTGADAEAAQQVLNVVLPLFGTWVGTVLAYYFSRDSFEAATNSTRRLVRDLSPEERLRAVSVSSAMTWNVYTSEASALLSAVITELDSKGIQRLPVVDSGKVLQALLFREDIKGYRNSLDDADKDVQTLQHLLDNEPGLKKPVAFVGRDVDLAEARDALQAVANAKVVLVTETGALDAPIVGILTNSDIAEHATL